MSMSSNQDRDDDGGAIADINVTPFIDVMLVLLIIFMVTAPLMMGGVKINLPKTTGVPMQRPDKPLIVSLDAQSKIYVDKEEVTADTRKAVFRELAVASESGEVFVRGDGEVKYGRMMDLMSELGQAGFARVTLVTNVQKGTADAAATPTDLTGAGATPAGTPGAAPAGSPAASPPPAAAPAPVSAPAASAQPAAPGI
ncbi:MAG: biopolymer transporter ExbD [Deltaproteobacteria bacterium]|jgi:biopolymer transport protein TolR|nr:biopolymer transporter ExbD [Deltaproteobacteria bacterium]